MKTILYLTRNGLMEPLGRSQILPYLVELSKDYRLIIITSEKEIDLINKRKFKEIKKLTEQRKIIWIYFKFNFSKYSIPFSLFKYLTFGIYICLIYKVDIIHCRSYIPNFVGLLLKIIKRNSLVFDMRGLWPEEIALSLINGQNSNIYKTLKFLEKISIYFSDSIVSLTYGAKYFLENKYKIKKNKIVVIPTCVDTRKFKLSTKNENKIKKFSCIGTILSDWFLFDWLKRFIYCVHEMDSSAQFEIISKDNKQIIYDKFNFNNEISQKIIIKSASPDDIPNLIKDHCASAMFFKPGLSKLGSSPTRFGEILATGKPVICNTGVGDLDNLITKNNVGVLVKDQDVKSMKNSVEELYELIANPNTPKKCRSLAESFYSLYSGVNQYSKIYNSLEN